MALTFFDANVTLGRHLKLTADGLYTAADYLAEMDHYAIAEALVIDSLSREFHPAEGNRRILETVAPHPRLHAAWSALPPGTDEQPAPAEFLAQMRAHRVAALFLFTNQFRISLADWCIDALLEPLAEARVPLFLNPNEVGPVPGGMDNTDWPGVVALCKRFPTLPVIITETRVRRTQRLAYRALDACPNLRIELSGWWLHHGVEYITRRWDSSRILFGSNWPNFGPHMTLATIACAEISDADKQAIAAGNLRKLLAWNPANAAQAPAFTPPPPVDDYHAFALTGIRPANMKFQDCHGHLGGRTAHYHIPDGDLPSIVHEMDRLGVEKICVFSFTGVRSDEVYGNDLVAAAVKQYPERLVGFTLVNPHRGREGMLRELERGARMGLRGVKLIPYYQGYNEDGELLDVPAQWAHERRQIILNHDWGTTAHMARLLKTFPDACFINGHTKLSFAPLTKEFPNLYICSCPLVPPRACEEAVAALGPDRLLFGSDLEDLPIAWGLGPILAARLPVETKRQILGGTLQRLLTKYSLHP